MWSNGGVIGYTTKLPGRMKDIRPQNAFELRRFLKVCSYALAVKRMARAYPRDCHAHAGNDIRIMSLNLRHELLVRHVAWRQLTRRRPRSENQAIFHP